MKGPGQRAKEYRDFVRGLNGRDKNGGTTLTIQEKKMLFLMKIECPCLSCTVLDRKTFRCPAKGCIVNPYKPRVCNTHNEMIFKANKEENPEELHSETTPSDDQEQKVSE